MILQPYEEVYLSVNNSNNYLDQMYVSHLNYRNLQQQLDDVSLISFGAPHLST